MKNSSRVNITETMESGCSLTHKKHKAKDDIISDLPESVITHILSFLPTKDAVRTSVLSKRWIEKWTLITKVKLDDSAFYSSKKKKSSGKQECFINFVNRVLLLAGTHTLESFSLVITNKYDLTVLNTLITFILKKRVKKLSISSSEELTFSALTTHYLFNHATCLEELVLNAYSSPIKIPIYKISGVFLFTSLKLLKLYQVILTIDKSQQIIFSVLKKLEFLNCSWLSGGVADVTLELKAPLLESVYIIQNYESLAREPRRCKIKLSDSHLKEFTYQGDGMSQDIVLSDPPSACNATFTITLWCGQETESCVSPLLKQFSHVKRINFEFWTQPNVAILPKFAMLSYLELASVSLEVLLGLIQNSPALNTLLFKGILKFNHELLFAKYLMENGTVPNCLTSTLQVVKFGCVRGNENELLFAKYLMENGTVLERMSFSLAHAELVKSKVIEEFKEKLYSFKKGIFFAILEFSYDYY